VAVFGAQAGGFFPGFLLGSALIGFIAHFTEEAIVTFGLAVFVQLRIAAP
jgi:biotin transporter BioY